MSRLTEIFENHANIDELCALLKHYGVNAQFVAEALTQSFEQLETDEGQPAEQEGQEQANANISQELVDDLKQYIARI